MAPVNTLHYMWMKYRNVLEEYKNPILVMKEIVPQIERAYVVRAKGVSLDAINPVSEHLNPWGLQGLQLAWINSLH